MRGPAESDRLSARSEDLHFAGKAQLVQLREEVRVPLALVRARLLGVEWP